MRLTTRARNRGWHGLDPITLETGFDLLTESGGQKAFRHLVNVDPDVIVGEWMCDPFSQMQNINRCKSRLLAHKLRAAQEKHRPLLRWIARVERWQRRRGKHWIGEQPSTCLSWKEPALQEMQDNVIIDMCTAADLRDPENGMPMRKRSKLNTTSGAVKTEMEQYICKGDHQHQPMEGTTRFKGVDGAWHSIHRTRFGG